MSILSVIISAFNEELYIEECLNSALIDCPADVEFIVVDDGSTDKTADIVTDIIGRVQDGPVIILKRNVGKGVMDAKKYGVELASGKYVIFLDADDTVEPGTYKKLIDLVEREQADIVCFGNDERKGNVVRPCFFASCSSDHQQRIRDCISLRTAPYLCTKIVRRVLLDQIAIPWGNMAEDWAICVQLFLLTDKVSLVDEVLYHYRILESSFSHSMSTKEMRLYKAMEEKKNIELICDIINDKGLADKYKYEIESRKTYVKRLLFPILKKGEDYALWRNTFPEINKSVFKNPLIKFEYKFKHYLSLAGMLHYIYPFLIIKRKLFSNV